MATDQAIRERFAVIEQAAGGPRIADTKAVLTETAKSLGVAYERAREAMLDFWAMRG